MTDKKQKPQPEPAVLHKPSQPWWRWVITIIAIGLFIVVIYKSKDDFLLTMQTASPGYALIGLLFLFISRQAVAARWYALLKTSQTPVSYLDALKLTYAGLFATNFLPTSIGGDLVRFVGMVQAGVDSALVLASLIMDRIIGLAGMSLMVPGGIFLLSHPIEPAVLSISSSFAFSASGFITWLNKLWQKLLAFIRKLIQDLIFWFKHPKNLLLSLFFTLIHEALLFGMLWFFLRSVGEDIPLWVIASIYSLSYLATLIPLSIGGLGIQEMSITYLYSHFGGVSVQAALALAVLTRIAFVINSLPGAFFLPSILRKQNQEKASTSK
jgi:glycosyltransferase 2 family protein